MSKNFFQRALKGSEESEVQDSNHLTTQTSWIARLSHNSRRPSMGFSDVTGTSLMDDDSNQGSGSGPGLVVPKSLFGFKTGESLETPSPGDPDGIFSVAVKQDKTIQLLKANEDYDVQMTTSTSYGAHLSDLVSEFPVATKESLKEIQEMKLRLKESENSDMFDMEVEDEGIKIKIPIPEEKPPSKILSKIMASGMTQSWFFRNPEQEVEEEQSSSRKSSSNTTPTIVLEDEENASSGFQFERKQKSSKKSSLSGMLSREEKREQRETNFFSPQNF